MRIILLTWIVIIILLGCATSPPLPKIETTRGDRIGIVVNIGNSPSHMHLGILNNFTQQYSYNWNLNAEVSRTVEQTVRNAGFTPVDLPAERISYSDVSRLILPVGDTWQLATGHEKMLRRLRDDLRLKAIIVLTKARVFLENRCYGTHCIDIYAEASGLYSDSLLFWTLYKAVTAFEWNVFVLDPLADTAKADTLSHYLYVNHSVYLPGFKDPADFNNLTAAEFAPVKAAILKSTESATLEAIKTLNPK
jgi:hypothetical protein